MSKSRVQRIVRNYIKKFNKSVFYQNIAIVASGLISAKAIALLSAPVITRIYSPEHYGIFSTLISIAGVAGSIATLRYSVTIALAKEERLAENLLKLSFFITFILSLLWLICILLFGEPLSNRFSGVNVKPFLWVIPLLFFGQGIYEALSGWAVRYKKFRIITFTRITQGVSTALTKILLGLLGIKPFGLILGNLAQEYTGIGSLIRNLVKTNPGFFKVFSFSEIKEAALRYKQFPLVQSWSQLLLSLGAQLPVLLMGNLYGAQIVGIFGLAQNMINIPINLLGQSVSQVYYAEISKYGKENPDRIYKLTISIIKKMFWLSFIPLTIIVLFGPWLFKVVFGAEWYEAGNFARIISILIMFRFVSNPIMSCLNVLEKQAIQFWLNLLRVILIFFIFYLAKCVELEPRISLLVYSILISIFYFFVVLIVLKLLKNMIKLLSN